jgi:flavin-dependent dehydrogenase
MAGYDIIAVGGGLGGAAVANVMARAGARVLVVERETHFRDRIRGEFMEPWG